MNKQAVSDYLLERYMLNELPSVRMQELSAAIERDPALQGRVKQMKKSSAAILKKYPPDILVPRMQGRAAMKRQASAPAKRIPIKYIIVPALAAASVVIVFLMSPLIQIDRSVWDPFTNETTRIKGTETQLYIYRKKGSEIEMLKNNDRVREKDLLQIAYFSAEDTYGAIVSIDGRGAVTVHYPKGNEQRAVIQKNRRILLKQAYELDDAPGFERFFFITTDAPVDLHKVCKAAEDLARDGGKSKTGRLTLDTQYQQVSLLLLKGK